MARKNPKLDKIYEVFDKHKVDIDRDSIWEVQGTPVVKHKDVERLGAVLGVKWDVPQVLRAERDEAVIMVTGRMGDKLEWSIGEALIVQPNQVGGNYKVTGKQASYPYAMAEKRGKDRVILKLADLHGDAYSSEEADDFREGASQSSSNQSSNNKATANNDNTIDPTKLLQDIKIDIDKTKSIKDLTDLMNHKDMKEDLKKLSKEEEQDAKAYATNHLKTKLGWTAPAKAEAANG
jgi:hypothetical protein